MYDASVVMYKTPTVFTPFNEWNFSKSDLSLVDYVQICAENELNVYKENREAMLNLTKFPLELTEKVTPFSSDTWENRKTTDMAYRLEELAIMCRKATLNYQFYITYKKLVEDFDVPYEFLRIFFRNENKHVIKLFNDKKVYSGLSEEEQAKLVENMDYYEECFVSGSRTDFSDVFKPNWGTHNLATLQNYKYVWSQFKKGLKRSIKDEKVVKWNEEYGSLPNNVFVFYGETETRTVEVTVQFKKFGVTLHHMGSNFDMKVKSKRK